MGFFDEKKKRSSVAASPALSQEPLSTPRQHAGFAPSLSDLERKDSKYKRTIRIFRFISRLLSFVANALMIGILSYSLWKYYTTRKREISSVNTSTAWAEPVLLWPTFALLGMACVTLCMNIFTLIAYCCSVFAANKVDSCSTWISYIFLGVHVLLWAIVSGAFKMASNGKDLWGYSCSSTADEIAEQVKDFLNFGKLCEYQTGAWYVSILEAVIYFITFITMVLVLRRESSKKKLGKMRASMNMEAGYNGVEMGGMRKQNRRYMPLAETAPGFQ